ncbi:S41 family peptidase [Oxyplasma meridianum]|uniref:Tricorn protease n=1 Tax=Oxyplasma meridianum TaxID=3073602 RepID=A0AAX4NHF4_9ARCH
MDQFKFNPDVSGERIVFVSNNDVWEVPFKGGKARRLTFGIGVVNSVRFSPDGSKIVIRSMRGNEAGYADIYMYNFENGKLTRITYLAGKSTSRRMYTDIAGWGADGNPILSTDAMSPFTAQTFLYSLSLDNLSINPLNLGQASHIIYHNGIIFLGRNTIDMLHWKGYRGGTKGHILKGRSRSEFHRLFNVDTHVSFPAICGERIFFISDHDGSGQIYSTNLNGEDMKCHTEFSKYYPRHLNSDGRKIVFSMGGSIYSLNPLENSTKEIVVSMDTGFSSTMERFVNTGRYLEEFHMNGDGEMISVVARGQGFIGNRNLETNMKLDTDGRVRQLKFLGSDRIIYANFSNGKEMIRVKEIKGLISKVCNEDYGLIEHIYPSPDGRMVAITNNRQQLLILETGTFEEVFREENREGIIEDISWSPDSKKVAYSFPVRKQFLGGHQGSVIKVYDIPEKKASILTTGNSRDYAPCFNMESNGVYYLSDRVLDPVPDKVVFDFGFPNATMVSFIPLGRGRNSIYDKIPSPFLPKAEDSGRIEESAFNSETLEIRNGDYRKILPLRNGILLLEYPVEGGMKYSTSPEVYRTGSLIYYSLKERTVKKLTEGIADFSSSLDRNTLLLKKAKNMLSVADITETGKLENVRLTEKDLDLDRIKIRIDPVSEWRLIFNEAWTLAVENYWDEKKALAIGEDVYRKYESLLGSISTRFELSEIIREMQGEFGTSHSYEMGGDLCEMEEFPVGRLGADLEMQGEGYLIRKIYSGDPSNEKEKSPLLSGTIPVREGDTILSIDGVKLGPSVTPGNTLYNRYDTPVKMEIKKKDGSIYSPFVIPVKDDRYIRYRSWVEEKRDYVHKKSNGKIGYLHIPDMGLNGFSEFFRLYGTESEMDGLIVDVRYNGGGSVSQILLEKLYRKRLGYDIPRRGNMHPYPADSVNGPIVAITNESAGSDGDIFSHAFKILNIGPVIGTRTWGGVVGISPRRKLVDGTTVTQPEFALWFGDVGFGIENHGAEPEEVEYLPQDYYSGSDPQLDAAIKRSLDLLDRDGHTVDFKP